jgi:phosphatidylglycerol---prolipoprotein diacylglyceryl transferase
MYPILFHIGRMPIRSWGVMVGIGIILGTYLCYRELQSRKMDVNLILDFVTYAVIAGFLGGRIWEVAFSWDNYQDQPLAVLAFWSGGLSIQGSVLGGLIAGIIYIKIKKIDFWEFADIVAPGLILGQAIGRIGCFLNGDAYGAPTNSIFGVIYQENTPAFAAYGSQPLFPAELFEGAGDFIILLALLMLIRKKIVPGTVFLTYFILYSINRFVLEFWRGDSLQISGLKVAQSLSLLSILIALSIMFYRFKVIKVEQK